MSLQLWASISPVTDLRQSGHHAGSRVIYYWDVKNQIVYGLLIYNKTAQVDLTAEQQKILSQ